MQAVTAEQMRAMDRAMITVHGVSGAELMERAGRGLALGIRRLCEARGLAHPAIRMVAGKGNNGGDVFAAAYHLYGHFPDLAIVSLGDPRRLTGEALFHYERIEGLVASVPLEDVAAWDGLCWHGNVDIVVDGLLGTGTTGAPREPVAGAIRAINRAAREGALVVAVDIPSGLCADTGMVSGDVVMADCTFTIGLPKRGLLQDAAMPYVGTLDVVEIGIPAALLPCSEGAEPALVTAGEVRSWLPRRMRAAHKGMFGRVLVIGGAPGSSGAIALAARAACRSGAGLVHVLTPAAVADRVAGMVPEAMVHAGASRDDGSLAGAALEASALPLAGFDVVLLGPGLTCHPEGARLITAAAALPASVLVLDADALTLLAASGGPLPGRQHGGLVLTPHPGEAGRLLGITTESVQADRVSAVHALADRYQATVVLKGAGTLISDGRACWMNLTGNPGMATGGSGDVLAGMAAGLMRQGTGTLETTCASVYIHGVAGDLSAWAGSQIGLTATGLLAGLPKAYGQVLGR